MFDIIELNETGTEEVKLERTTTSSPTTGTTVHISASTTSAASQETTHTIPVLHSKVPQQVASEENVTLVLITNYTNSGKALANLKLQPIKKMFGDKDLHKEKTVNHLSTKEDDKSLSKEVEMLPDLQNSLIKLNRTNRKELPIQELKDDKEIIEIFGKSKLAAEESDHNVKKLPARMKLDNDVNSSIPKLVKENSDDDNRNQHIEIKIRRTDDINSSSIFVTTKKPDQINETSSNVETLPSKPAVKKQYVEWPEDSSTQHNFLIDPKIENLNINAPENSESEVFVPSPSKYPERLQQLPGESVLIKQQPQEKSLLGETQAAKKSSQDTTEDPSFHAEKKPNRKRQLTRPPSRSFYPYFFSRVLG